MTSVRPSRWLARLFARRAEKTRVSPYHSVAIFCGENACQAAQESVGERHLSAEAPMLPLGQCDRPDQCECRYQHYEDRRSGPRRNSEHEMPAKETFEGDERRHVTDRRADDVSDEAEPFSVHEDSYYEHVGDTIRSAALEDSEPDGFDPYNSGSFDNKKSWKSNSR